MKPFARFLFALFLLSLTTNWSGVLADNLPGGDSRSTWQCAYPYTDTNCQNILVAWSDDRDLPVETVFDGSDCSGCEPTYYTDQNGMRHLLYAKCSNRFGARLTAQSFLEAIKKYKESNGQATGWNVVGWQFNKCFETWECGEYCSLQFSPPVCLRYQTTNWGLYVPVTGSACGYGTTEPPTPSEPATPSSGTQSSPMQRDSTWEPVF